MDEKDRYKILRGTLENLPDDRSKSIRIFISSTFTGLFTDPEY